MLARLLNEISIEGVEIVDLRLNGGRNMNSIFRAYAVFPDILARVLGGAARHAANDDEAVFEKRFNLCPALHRDGALAP